ncbi:MAG TPA: hypothetical protein VJT75_17270 [Thermoleophilaceae bacterium]|nr:hypothetical protein [Thermoleophilaceae bacterium]
MPISDPIDTTIDSGFTVLHETKLFHLRARLTITANSNPEAGDIRFRTISGPGGRVNESTGNEVVVGFPHTLGRTTIEAAPPEGVTSVDITYVIKTGRDAR